MPFLKSFSAGLASALALYGGWGLFGISFLDSSFLSFPLVNDLLLIHLAGRFPAKAPVYALACAAGSTLGAGAVFAMARAGGELLRRKRPPARETRVRRWLERNDFVAMLVASLLPPPAPFKLFAITAGALRVNSVRFGSALLVGRSLRFVIVALMGARYGARAETYLRHNTAWLSAVTLVLILAGTLVYRRCARRYDAG